MKIFLSYPSETAETADRINLALVNQGYDVFFDNDRMSGSDDFNQTIERELSDSDLMIFLVTKKSVAKGSYTRTELKWARKRWRSPHGRLLPVMIEKTPISSLPSYLRAVTIEEPEGGVAAEVVARVNEMQAGLAPADEVPGDFVEQAVSWCLSWQRLIHCGTTEKLLYRVKKGINSGRWEQLRLQFPAPRHICMDLERRRMRLGMPTAIGVESIPENFDAEFEASEQQGLKALVDALDASKTGIASTMGQLVGKNVRTRQACLLAVAIGQIEGQFMDFVQSPEDMKCFDECAEAGIMGRIEAWRDRRRNDRFNRRNLNAAVRAQFANAEEAAEHLSVRRGWTKAFVPAVESFVELLFDDYFRRKLRQDIAAEKLLNQILVWRLAVAKQVDGLLIKLTS